MIDARLAPRAHLQAGGSRQARALIGGEGFFDSIMFDERSRKREAILYRHGRALSDKGQHGMAGIAEQSGAPLNPSRQGIAIKQPP